MSIWKNIKKEKNLTQKKSKSDQETKIDEFIRFGEEIETELNSIKQKKDRFREWTKSLGESAKVLEMFQQFDQRIEVLEKRLQHYTRVRERIAQDPAFNLSTAAFLEQSQSIADLYDTAVSPEDADFNRLIESELDNRGPASDKNLLSTGKIPLSASVKTGSDEEPPFPHFPKIELPQHVIKNKKNVIVDKQELPEEAGETGRVDDFVKVGKTIPGEIKPAEADQQEIVSSISEISNLREVSQVENEVEAISETSEFEGEDESVQATKISATQTLSPDDSEQIEALSISSKVDIASSAPKAESSNNLTPGTKDSHPEVNDALAPDVREEKEKIKRQSIPQHILQARQDGFLAKTTETEISLSGNEENFSSEKQEKFFSVKRIKSRFSLRKSNKSKEKRKIMENEKGHVPAADQKQAPQTKKNSSSTHKKSENKKAKLVDDKSVLYLGIDLGTSQTTIAASNGVLETVLSVVGIPKDIISQKLLKKDKLFGLEALRHKLALKLYRPLEKGVIKDTEADIEAARELIQHVINLANPDEYEKVYAVIGAPARSSFANQQALMDAAREAIDAVMLVSEPFAVAYGKGNIYNSLVIDIGAGTTDICCLKGSMPQDEDQFTLLKAGDYIDYQLVDNILKKIPGAQVTKDMAKKFKEEHSFVLEHEKPAIVEITITGKPAKVDITKDICKSCESIVPEIMTCTKSIISNFNPEFQNELKQNILLAGGGSLIRNIERYLERQLRSLGNVKVTRVEEPIIAGAKGALLLAKDLTDDYWQAL